MNFIVKKLFVVKHRSKYSCESSIYFDLGSDIIKEIAISLITLIIPKPN